MQGNRRRDTTPELAVRQLLHRAGLRYRVDVKPVPDLRRHADIVFRNRRLAIFIDGCYWHGCAQHLTIPMTDAEYRRNKIEANCRRDRDTDTKLSAAGWLAARYWEHEHPEQVAENIYLLPERLACR